MESAKRLWHVDNRPEGRRASEITSLIEHYYKVPNINERAREAQHAAWKSVENLFGSEFWRELSESDQASWTEIDEDAFQSFDLDGIQVYARIDFAASSGFGTDQGPGAGYHRLEDWGRIPARSRAAYDLQLIRPAQVGMGPAANLPCGCISLSRFSHGTFNPTPDDIEAARQEAKRSFDQMLELEPVFGPAPIEEFPMTHDPKHCAWCGFQGICEGAMRMEPPS